MVNRVAVHELRDSDKFACWMVVFCTTLLLSQEWLTMALSAIGAAIAFFAGIVCRMDEDGYPPARGET